MEQNLYNSQLPNPEEKGFDDAGIPETWEQRFANDIEDMPEQTEQDQDLVLTCSEYDDEGYHHSHFSVQYFDSEEEESEEEESDDSAAYPLEEVQAEVVDRPLIEFVNNERDEDIAEDLVLDTLFSPGDVGGTSLECGFEPEIDCEGSMIFYRKKKGILKTKEYFPMVLPYIACHQFADEHSTILSKRVVETGEISEMIVDVSMGALNDDVMSYCVLKRVWNYIQKHLHHDFEHHNLVYETTQRRMTQFHQIFERHTSWRALPSDFGKVVYQNGKGETVAPVSGKSAPTPPDSDDESSTSRDVEVLGNAPEFDDRQFKGKNAALLMRSHHRVDLKEKTLHLLRMQEEEEERKKNKEEEDD